MNKDIISKIRREAQELMGWDELDRRVKTSLGNLVDLVDELVKKMSTMDEAGGVSPEARILKSRLEASKADMRKVEKEKAGMIAAVNFMFRSVLTESVAIINRTKGIPGQEENLRNAQKIAAEIKQVVIELQDKKAS